MSDKMMLKKQIAKRRPAFIRQEGTSKKKLQKVKWRKPKGYHSKMRRKFAGRRAMPSPGYGSPKELKGLTMKGLNPVLVRNLADAAGLVAKKDGAIIANVGKKLKVELLKVLAAAKVDVLNVLNPEKFVAEVEAQIKKKQEEKKAKEEKKKKSKAESLKKAEEKKKEKAEEKTDEEIKKEQAEEQRKLLEKPKH